MMLALLAALFIALLSLIGVFFFGKNGKLTGTHRYILPVAVGVFLGVSFFELIPETLDASPELGPIAIVCGFLGFYLLSHILSTFHHHHHHSHDSCARNGAHMLLWGDTIHNFADGVVIASAFMVNPVVGFGATLGIALHEIPQEIAEFGVLLASGCTRKRAALYNLLSALSALVGVVVTYAFANSLGDYVFMLTGIAAGNLLYIATADFIPELRESHRDHFGKTFTATVCGVIAIAFLVSITH